MDERHIDDTLSSPAGHPLTRIEGDASFYLIHGCAQGALHPCCSPLRIGRGFVDLCDTE